MTMIGEIDPQQLTQEVPLEQQIIPEHSISQVQRPQNRLRSVRRVASIVLIGASTAAAPALAKEFPTPTPENPLDPNNITLVEAKACAAEVDNPDNIPYLTVKVPEIKRGSNVTTGPLRFETGLNLKNRCVENSPSFSSRWHSAGNRAIHAAYRVREKGEKRYSDWKIIEPSMLGMEFSPSPNNKNVTHTRRTKDEDNGMTTTGKIITKLRLGSSKSRYPRLKKGDRLEGGTFVTWRSNRAYPMPNVKDNITGGPVYEVPGKARITKRSKSVTVK